jgi:hypothetical protein
MILQSGSGQAVRAVFITLPHQSFARSRKRDSGHTSASAPIGGCSSGLLPRQLHLWNFDRTRPRNKSENAKSHRSGRYRLPRLYGREPSGHHLFSDFVRPTLKRCCPRMLTGEAQMCTIEDDGLAEVTLKVVKRLNLRRFRVIPKRSANCLFRIPNDKRRS